MLLITAAARSLLAVAMVDERRDGGSPRSSSASGVGSGGLQMRITIEGVEVVVEDNHHVVAGSVPGPSSVGVGRSTGRGSV